MKLNIKKLSLYSLICLSGMGLSSCEDFLDRQPITAVTPEAYFTTADQVANYVNNYYNSYLVNSQGQSLFHSQGWNSGIIIIDNLRAALLHEGLHLRRTRGYLIDCPDNGLVLQTINSPSSERGFSHNDLFRYIQYIKRDLKRDYKLNWNSTCRLFINHNDIGNQCISQ